MNDFSPSLCSPLLSPHTTGGAGPPTAPPTEKASVRHWDASETPSPDADPGVPDPGGKVGPPLAPPPSEPTMAPARRYPTVAVAVEGPLIKKLSKSKRS